jgi:hypothetical protein
LASSVGTIICFSYKKIVMVMNTSSKDARRTGTTQDDARTWNNPHAQISLCWSSSGV